MAVRLRVRIWGGGRSGSLATTGVRVTGPQYAPPVMDDQMPALSRDGLSVAWFTRAGTSSEYHRGSVDRWPATHAHATDDDLPIGKRWSNQ